ncbi:MAG: discoidin domain-containing protein [Clostridia bacterium]|nr:discoidin domain-containing protein [Clostridia bacterium]
MKLKHTRRKNRFALRFIALLIAISSLMTLASSAVIAEEADFNISENYAQNKGCRVNNAYSQAPKEMALDGDTGSFWRTNSTCKDDFIYLVADLGSKVEINFIYLYLYRMNCMSTVKLQYTDDATPDTNSEWKDIKTIAGKAIKEKMAVSFEPVMATGLRFYATLSTKSAGLYEFQAYYTNDAAAAEELINRVSFKEFVQPEDTDAKIVSVGENGELVYLDYDGNGGKLLDYSRVGYHNGDEPIPSVKTVKTIEPGKQTDHTELIQKAIDEVSALPESKRGAILLKAGKYTVSDTLKINTSGVILRGEGQGENGTVIYDVRTETDCTTLQLKGDSAYTGVKNTTAELIAEYVPMGETVLALSSVGKYTPGDNVRVVCTPNDLWIKTLGMDLLPGDGILQWKASDYVMTYERTVEAVDSTNKTVTLDTGIPLTLDKKYYSVTVQKITDDPARIKESGVENLRFLSYYNGNAMDEEHAWTAVAFSNCRNCWAKDVTAKNYAYATVKVGGKAINVTVEGCSFLEPISKVEGGRRYSFCINGGQYTLVKNCYSYDSRHDYVVQQRVGGPNVFIDCVAEDSNSVSEPHHRWSTGTLYDNVYQIGQYRLGYFEAVNRGNSGTGHGWSGANTVFWNCLSPAIVVGKPQTEENFAIGVYGIFKNDLKNNYLGMYKNGFVKPSVTTPNYPETSDHKNSPMYGNGYIESAYNPVNPSSLYRAQLAYRLNGNATIGVAPNAPILELPMADITVKSRTLTLSGICDSAAEKVYVYIDGIKNEATLATDGSCAFSFDALPENGYHDICVTQVINEIESPHNAIRTVLVSHEGTVAPPDGQAPNGSNAENNVEIVIIAIIGAVTLTAAGIGVALVIKTVKRRKTDN